MNELQSYVPLAGVATAVAIWLRQYWFQQRLTNEIVAQLRLDNERLRTENTHLQRENTVLRAHADEVDLEMLEALRVVEEQEKEKPNE